MTYFSDNYPQLSYPISEGDTPGLRDAQRGALFAVGAHFTQRSEAAIVTMPTGSGKTAVLQACAFLLKANRVLILTPSRLVREQIADDFKALGVLKRLGALPHEIEPPRVMATAGRIVDPTGWEAMRDFQVVVATVPSVSPHLAEIPLPPDDLFDLILVDEAHHSPAITWRMMLDVFPAARKVLFTATPFRRDDREIKGRFVYSYDLKRAYDDGVFGHISYQPVPVPNGPGDERQREDIAIATAAEARLAADRAAGFDHLLMVRTDGRTRAIGLEAIYAKHTRLRLQSIHGQHSLAHVKKVLAKLKDGTLDGIICVNMLGEGFDMPRLKVAAVHAPHRSLAVTLQFIGRFARTAGANLGDATFLAAPSAVEVEAKRLYATGAVWAEMIPNLSEARVTREVEARETLDTFNIAMPTVPDLSDLSLFTISPYAHVKIFRLREPFDITKEPSFGVDRETVFGRVSEKENSSIYITRKAGTVAWSDDDRLIDVRFDVFIFYYDMKARLLFVCASKRADGLYRRIVRDLVGYDPRILSVEMLNRALKELDQARFYNIGMKNRQQSSLTESYRMLAGSHVDEAIRPEDARLFNRGHCFGSAVEDGKDITIGLSSASKIWSNTAFPLPELLGWCRKLARKIHDKKAAVTGSKLDLLQTGKMVTRIPARVLFGVWAKSVYIDPPLAVFDRAGQISSTPLTDIDLIVESSDADTAVFKLEGHQLSTTLIFRLSSDAFFAYQDDNQTRVRLRRGRDEEDLVDYLNDDPLALMLDDWSSLVGDEHLSAPEGGFEPYDRGLIEAVDWAAEGIDVTIEYEAGPRLQTSIQGYLSRVLDALPYDVVYWDHGSGEAADFVTFAIRADGGADIRFFHCKSSSSTNPGNRVGDLYEVCGQAVKGIIWCDLPRLVDRLLGRFARKAGMAKFIRGDAAQLRAFSTLRPVHYQMVVVQPGIARGVMDQKLGEILGAANTHLVNAGHLELATMGAMG